LRRSAVAGAEGKVLRRAEMRELTCALNLPTVIGQAPQSQYRGDRTVRFPVVMAESWGLLFSLGDTYSIALSAMMSTPEWSLRCLMGYSR
jgi:hypothetical protein